MVTSHWSRLRSHPFTVLLVGATALYLACVAIAPEMVQGLIRTDGPIEDVGHVVLLGAIALWTWLAARVARERGAAVAAVVAVAVVYLLFLEMEEINWGDVYRLDLGASYVKALVGTSTFHRAYRNSFFANLTSVVITLPIAIYFGTAVLPRRGARLHAWLGPAGALRSEGLLFFATAVVAQVLDTIPLVELRMGKDPSTWGYDSPLGYFQILVYALIAVVPLRALATRRSSPAAAHDTRDPGQHAEVASHQEVDLD